MATRRQRILDTDSKQLYVSGGWSEEPLIWDVEDGQVDVAELAAALGFSSGSVALGHDLGGLIIEEGEDGWSTNFSNLLEQLRQQSNKPGLGFTAQNPVPFCGMPDGEVWVMGGRIEEAFGIRLIHGQVDIVNLARILGFDAESMCLGHEVDQYNIQKGDKGFSCNFHQPLRQLAQQLGTPCLGFVQNAVPICGVPLQRNA